MKNKIPQIALSVLFITGYFAVLWMLLSGEIMIQENIRDVSIVLLGILAREVSSIMSFWFGSSSGSKDKDAVKIDELNKN